MEHTDREYELEDRYWQVMMELQQFLLELSIKDSDRAKVWLEALRKRVTAYNPIEDMQHPKWNAERYNEDKRVKFYVPCPDAGLGGWSSLGVFVDLNKATDAIMSYVTKDGLTWDSVNLRTVEDRSDTEGHAPIHYIETLELPENSMITYELSGLVQRSYR